MTPQERAAALCRALLQDLECRNEFTRRDVDPVTKLEWNQQWQDMILLVIQQTRRAALLECAKVARNRADLYKPKLGLWLNMVNYHRSQEADDLADTLDRLAQEG